MLVNLVGRLTYYLKIIIIIIIYGGWRGIEDLRCLVGGSEVEVYFN
jgi:hypothetical protein